MKCVQSWGDTRKQGQGRWRRCAERWRWIKMNLQMMCGRRGAGECSYFSLVKIPRSGCPPFASLPHTSLAVCPVKRSLSLNGNRGSSDNRVDSSRAFFFSSLSPRRSRAEPPYLGCSRIWSTSRVRSLKVHLEGEGKDNRKIRKRDSVLLVLDTFFSQSFLQK